MQKFCCSVVGFFLFASTAFAEIGNSWHCPANAEACSSVTMRSPQTPTANQTVTIHNGTYDPDSDQSGGTLFYRKTGASSWTSAALSFGCQTSNNKYWRATIPANTFTGGDTIQYYIRVTYAAGQGSRSDETTFLYSGCGTRTTTEATAQASPFTFTYASNPELTVNGVNANYTTTKLFIDETAGESTDLTIVFKPDAANVNPSTVQVYSNLNRRDRAGVDADGDGIEDGIHPPSGDLVGTDDTHYYRAYTMNDVGGGQYSVTLPANQTGAYRLTGRYQTTTNPGVWVYYSSGGRRDHAIVVSPNKARDVVMYELNTLNVSASGSTFSQRSTFEDLWGGPGATQFGRFNLNYARNLGVNWLWFQPIHPQGIENSGTDPDTGGPWEIGSPYAVKNFFEIQPLMSKANTRPAAMQAFADFVSAADAAGINVMLDAAFNHTSHDCELAEPGVQLFAPGANPAAKIKDHEARFYSRSGDYCQRATSASNPAVAPDRGDFGKWNDTLDVYFGRYAALVCQNPADNGNFQNEGDWFNYTDPNWTSDNVTKNVWKYFAEYVLYWLDKTGHPAGTPASESDKGIDGLRADFGQGLPPQAWEYIINKTRTRKWDLVYMAETLDSGAPSYRSNRHFDILNESIIFALASATTPSAYRGLYEDRRQAFGQGLVLLNTVSHDEENYVDPWQALIRYSASATIDGAPMIFMGQELGISRTFGFDRYELNFGKYVPHFKKFNSMMPIWNDSDFGNDQLYPVYSAINKARQSSRALRSSRRYFLDQTSGGAHAQIYSVAKFEAPNGSPGTSDVVFAFVNLDRDNNRSGSFNVNITQNGANLFGIKAGRTYNVKNIAAYSAQDSTRSNQWLWGSGRTGTDVLNNGVFVSMNRVPTSAGAWSTAPFEAQYLKLFDVTPPPAPGTPTPLAGYAIGTIATFSWLPASDPEGGISGYRLIVGTAPGGSDVFDALVGDVLTHSVTGSAGQTLYARVIALNNAAVQGASSGNSVGVQLLDPAGDADGDGYSNQEEHDAGTDPLDAGSVPGGQPLPVAHAQATATSKNTAKNLVLTGNDPQGQPIRFLLAQPPANGRLTEIGSITGTVTYTPTNGFAGVDAFQFRVHNGSKTSLAATVSIHVTNRAPTAANISVNITQNVARVISLRGTDADRDTLSVLIVTNPVNGVISDITGTNVTYTPNPNFEGVDLFKYVVHDGTTNSAIAQCTVTVIPKYSYQHAEFLWINPVGATRLTLTDNGVSTSQALGFPFRFHGRNYSATIVGANGLMGFTSAGLTNATNVPIGSNAVPNAFIAPFWDDLDPAAGGDVYLQKGGVASNRWAVVTWLNVPRKGTSTPLSFQVLLRETVNTIQFQYLNVGEFDHVYGRGRSATVGVEDHLGLVGTQFSFNSPALTNGMALLWVAGNHIPVPDPQSLVTTRNGSIDITLTATDPDSETLTYNIVSGPSHGNLTGSGANWTYTPNAGFQGDDNFVFSVSDGFSTRTAAVTISIGKPIAHAQSVSTAEDTPATITLSATDPDGDALTYVIVNAPTRGKLSGVAPNLTYAPNANYNGADTLRFRVFDGVVSSEVATVSITVTPVNDPPVARAQTVNVLENEPRFIKLVATDVDTPVSNLTFIIVTAPTNGVLTGTPPDLTYTPHAEFSGPDAFTFKANDGFLDSAPAKVTLKVIPLYAAVEVQYDWVDIASTGTVLNLADNGVSAAQKLGFIFRYFNVDYSSVLIGANGLLGFTTSGLTNAGNVNMPITLAPNAFLAPYWDDLDPSAGGQIRLLTGGTVSNRYAVISWLGVPLKATGTPLTFQTVLREGHNDITFQYQNAGTNDLVHGAGRAATVGIEDQTGTVATKITFNGSELLDDELAILFWTGNHAPLAYDQFISVPANTSTNITLTGQDPDGGAITFSIATNPAHGALSGFNPSTGVVTYTPGAGFTGNDSFNFRVHDDSPRTGIGIISISIGP